MTLPYMESISIKSIIKVYKPISFNFPGSQKSTKSPVITTPLSLKSKYF